MKILLGCLVLLGAPLHALADEVVYQSEWEKADDPIGVEWTTNGQVEISPNGKRVYLGELSDRGAILTLKKLPAHKVLRIQCDLIVRGSWDGGRSGNGGDRVQMWLGDGRDLLDSTFANRTAELAGELSQSYPLSWAFGREFMEKHGAAEIASLGYAEREADGVTLTPNDAIYKLDFHVPHEGDMMRLCIRCRNYYDKYQDQSAGLDQVRVTAIAETTTFDDAEWKKLVAQLEGEDVMAADAAAWRMMAAPAQAAKYLEVKRVEIDDLVFAKMLRNLAEADEKVHDKAAEDMEALGRGGITKIYAASIVHDDPVVVARLANVIAEIRAGDEGEFGRLDSFKVRMRSLLHLPRVE